MAYNFVRILLTCWFAVPLIILGAVLAYIWKPLGVLGLVGMWAMGMDNVIG